MEIWYTFPHLACFLLVPSSGTVFRCHVVRHASQPAEGPSLGVGVAAREGGEGEAVQRARRSSGQEEEGTFQAATGRDEHGTVATGTKSLFSFDSFLRLLTYFWFTL